MPERLELPYWREVLAGGAVGTALRLSVDALVGSPFGDWDAGVFAANVSGAFLLGVIAGVPLKQATRATQTRWRAFAGTGILGAYTTFSALALAFVDGTDPAAAAAGLAASITGGLLAAWAGLTLAQQGSPRIRPGRS